MGDHHTDRENGILRLSHKPAADEYCRAALVMSRRVGTMKLLFPMLIFAAALLLSGIWIFSWFRASFGSIAVPILFFVSCAVILAVFLVIEPARVRSRAMKEYEYQLRFMKDASLIFERDELVIESPGFRMREPYALMHECVETSSLFIIIRDSQRLLAVPKRAFAEGKEFESAEFLRGIFARRRHVMRGWFI